MKRTTFRRTLGAVLAILLFATTMFGGINSVGAQEPDTKGTPAAGSDADKAAPPAAVTSAEPSDCFIVSAVEDVPIATEDGSGDGGTTINIEITINVDSEGNVTIEGPASGAVPSSEGFASSEDPNIAVTELKPTDVVTTDKVPADKVTSGEVPANIGEGEFVIADSACGVFSEVGGEGIPTDDTTTSEPTTGTAESTDDSADATPEADLTPADDTTSESETCTVVKETKLADGTTEKVLSCPAA